MLTTSRDDSSAALYECFGNRRVCCRRYLAPRFFATLISQGHRLPRRSRWDVRAVSWTNAFPADRCPPLPFWRRKHPGGKTVVKLPGFAKKGPGTRAGMPRGAAGRVELTLRSAPSPSVLPQSYGGRPKRAIKCAGHWAFGNAAQPRRWSGLVLFRPVPAGRC